MYLTVFVSVLITAITGLIAKFIVDRKSVLYEITWIEYTIVMVVIAFLAAPLSVWSGWELAKRNKLTFNEFWGGWEQSAITEEIDCYRDGPCYWEYDCDPYIVMVECNCHYVSSGSGSSQTSTRVCDQCPETRYHDCPYVDQEINYTVNTSVGEFTIDSNRFPENPQQHRWRENESIPDSVVNRAGTGIPKFWEEVKKRIQENSPGPVTIRKPYINYIYASEQTILKEFSAEIEDFRKKGLLPNFQNSIYNFYFSDKVYFIGLNSVNKQKWLESLNYFNAALGSTLKGDLHLVITDNQEIAGNPDNYTLALKAYWQNTTLHNKDSLSKNAIVVVCVITDNKITWARSFTGMPMGNEMMMTKIDSLLRGVELKPEIIIGNMKGKFNLAKIKKEEKNGILEDIIFGLSDSSTRFKRISMSAEDANDAGSGFTYLSSQIEPSSLQKMLIYISTFFFCSLGWVAAILIGNRQEKTRRSTRF